MHSFWKGSRLMWDPSCLFACLGSGHLAGTHAKLDPCRAEVVVQGAVQYIDKLQTEEEEETLYPSHAYHATVPRLFSVPDGTVLVSSGVQPHAPTSLVRLSPPSIWC